MHLKTSYFTRYIQSIRQKVKILIQAWDTPRKLPLTPCSCLRPQAAVLWSFTPHPGGPILDPVYVKSVASLHSSCIETKQDSNTTLSGHKVPSSTGGSRVFNASAPPHWEMRSVLWTHCVHTCRGEGTCCKLADDQFFPLFRLFRF